MQKFFLGLYGKILKTNQQKWDEQNAATYIRKGKKKMASNH